jgi:hypothetical protein
MPTLCESLRLPLLVDSEDMSFHWKFLELQNGQAADYVNDGKGGLDVEKFIHWWMMDLHDFFHKNDPKPEE